MFLHVSKYDWLSLRANRSFYVIIALMSGLVWFSLWVGVKRIAFQQETLQKIATQQQADYEKYRKLISDINAGMHFDGGHFGDPTNPFYFGNRMGAQYASLPPAPLAIISVGQSDLMPYYYKITLSKRQALFHSEELENPQVLYNGHFDLAFVIVFLLPLLIVALSYQIISSEREQGTLPLLLSENVSLRTIAGYRYLFRYLLFHVLLTLFIVIGLLLAGVSLIANADRLFALLIAVWIYGAFWFSVAYLVNSIGHSSGINAAILVSIWLLLMVFVPALLSVWVNRVYPMPSRIALIAQSRQIADELAKNKDALQRFYEEHPELKPVQANPQDRTASMLFSRLQVELSMEKEREAFTLQAAARRQMVNRYRLFSPSIIMIELLNEIASTGETVYSDFDKQVAAYHSRFRDYFAPLVFRQEKFGVAQLEGVPKFQYHAPNFQPLAASFGSNLIYMCCLALAGIFIASYRTVKISPAYN
jgi:ABC-2 type transport system permease protein